MSCIFKIGDKVRFKETPIHLKYQRQHFPYSKNEFKVKHITGSDTNMWYLHFEGWSFPCGVLEYRLEKIENQVKLNPLENYQIRWGLVYKNTGEVCRVFKTRGEARDMCLRNIHTIKKIELKVID